ncbi:MAG: orotidine-5'-phosphate decarboxylase [Nanoarchaeota archaeon]|nr:orotidine-5'-phosphate decarboxylase [Nanoarchaeota archaeon]MCG2719009.1 orotidine-5'-phosphate decarboxylase [Nanoarchaeota archaeon]
MKLTKKQVEAKERLCLAIDLPFVRDALKLADELKDYVGMFKIGKQLHTAAGNEGFNIIRELYKKGPEIFLDLKLHDTPKTVYGASRACTVKGVYMFNIHIAGGEKMCRKAVEAAKEEAYKKGIQEPKVIGVTVLTSLKDSDLEEQKFGINYDDLVKKRTELAKIWDLDGIVCPANKAGLLEKIYGKDFLYVTPGIEWKGKKGKGQEQLYTPDKAVKDCKSSILVVGSAITGTRDKRKTAYDILEAMAKEL